MYTVYGDLRSGNCYKIKALMDLLEIPHQWQFIDIFKGESRQPEFLAKNPNGRIPVLRTPDGDYLCESNAILFYLGEGSSWIPEGRLERARMLQWMFFEQYSHEPFIATSRYWITLLGQADRFAREIADRRSGGEAALKVMESHLQTHDFFTGDAPGIADIALFAYTHVADEGGFSLSPYPAIRRWIDRMAALPRFRTMKQMTAQEPRP